MGNGVSTDQGNFPTHGIRDVRRAADRKQHDWSPLAEAPITKQPNLLIATANSYIVARTWGRETSRSTEDSSHVGSATSYIGTSNMGPSSSEDNTCQNRKSSVMKDDCSELDRLSSIADVDLSSSEEERRSSRRREKDQRYYAS